MRALATLALYAAVGCGSSSSQTDTGSTGDPSTDGEAGEDTVGSNGTSSGGVDTSTSRDGSGTDTGTSSDSGSESGSGSGSGSDSGSESGSGSDSTSDSSSESTSDSTSDSGVQGSCADGCAPELVCDGDTCVDLGPRYPVAPTMDNRMWQTVQEQYVLESGQTCHATVTAALGDQTSCYVAADGELMCAGRVFEYDFGPSFTGTGQMNVEQILIRPTFNAEDGNGMCILREGAAYCVGRNNNNGPYGTGNTDDLAEWTQWGTADDLARIGTGTFDSICALTETGDVFCSGYNFGLSPSLQQTGATWFWLDTFGELNVDDPAVWRAQQGRTECTIGAAGLDCPFGLALTGELVDGGFVGGLDIEEPNCALDADATVTCTGPFPTTVFEEGRVLSISHHAYEEAGPAMEGPPPGICAVYDDGSLWCIGANATGRMGTGDYEHLFVETQVQPPGSVRVTCELD